MDISRVGLEGIEVVVWFWGEAAAAAAAAVAVSAPPGAVIVPASASATIAVRAAAAAAKTAGAATSAPAAKAAATSASAATVAAAVASSATAAGAAVAAVATGAASADTLQEDRCGGALKLYFKLGIGKPYQQYVLRTTFVGEIRLRIAAALGVKFWRVHLYFNEKELIDDQTLNDCGIASGSIISVFLDLSTCCPLLHEGVLDFVTRQQKGAAWFQVIFGGHVRSVCFYIAPTQFVGDIKRAVAAKCGVKYWEIRLHFAGKDLVDGRHVFHYDLRNGSTVEVFKRMFGGARSHSLKGGYEGQPLRRSSRLNSLHDEERCAIHDEWEVIPGCFAGKYIVSPRVVDILANLIPRRVPMMASPDGNCLFHACKYMLRQGFMSLEDVDFTQDFLERIKPLMGNDINNFRSHVVYAENSIFSDEEWLNMLSEGSMSKNDYIYNMLINARFGGEVELAAICKIWNCKITIIHDTSSMTQVMGNEKDPAFQLCLVYYDGTTAGVAQHYIASRRSDTQVDTSDESFERWCSAEKKEADENTVMEYACADCVVEDKGDIDVVIFAATVTEAITEAAISTDDVEPAVDGKNGNNASIESSHRIRVLPNRCVAHGKPDESKKTSTSRAITIFGERQHAVNVKYKFVSKRAAQLLLMEGTEQVFETAVGFLFLSSTHNLGFALLSNVGHVPPKFQKLIKSRYEAAKYHLSDHEKAFFCSIGETTHGAPQCKFECLKACACTLCICPADGHQDRTGILGYMATSDWAGSTIRAASKESWALQVHVKCCGYVLHEHVMFGMLPEFTAFGDDSSYRGLAEKCTAACFPRTSMPDRPEGSKVVVPMIAASGFFANQETDEVDAHDVVNECLHFQTQMDSEYDSNSDWYFRQFGKEWRVQTLLAFKLSAVKLSCLSNVLQRKIALVWGLQHPSTHVFGWAAKYGAEQEKHTFTFEGIVCRNEFDGTSPKPFAVCAFASVLYPLVVSSVIATFDVDEETNGFVRHEKNFVEQDQTVLHGLFTDEGQSSTSDSFTDEGEPVRCRDVIHRDESTVHTSLEEMEGGIEERHTITQFLRECVKKGSTSLNELKDAANSDDINISVSRLENFNPVFVDESNVHKGIDVSGSSREIYNDAAIQPSHSIDTDALFLVVKPEHFSSALSGRHPRQMSRSLTLFSNPSHPLLGRNSALKFANGMNVSERPTLLLAHFVNPEPLQKVGVHLVFTCDGTGSENAVEHIRSLLVECSHVADELFSKLSVDHHLSAVFDLKANKMVQVGITMAQFSFMISTLADAIEDTQYKNIMHILVRNVDGKKNISNCCNTKVHHSATVFALQENFGLPHRAEASETDTGMILKLQADKNAQTVALVRTSVILQRLMHKDVGLLKSNVTLYPLYFLSEVAGFKYSPQQGKECLLGLVKGLVCYYPQLKRISTTAGVYRNFAKMTDVFFIAMSTSVDAPDRKTVLLKKLTAYVACVESLLADISKINSCDFRAEFRVDGRFTCIAQELCFAFCRPHIVHRYDIKESEPIPLPVNSFVGWCQSLIWRLFNASVKNLKHIFNKGSVYREMFLFQVLVDDLLRYTLTGSTYGIGLKAFFSKKPRNIHDEFIRYGIEASCREKSQLLVPNGILSKGLVDELRITVHHTNDFLGAIKRCLTGNMDQQNTLLYVLLFQTHRVHSQKEIAMLDSCWLLLHSFVSTMHKFVIGGVTLSGSDNIGTRLAPLLKPSVDHQRIKNTFEDYLHELLPLGGGEHDSLPVVALFNALIKSHGEDKARYIRFGLVVLICWYSESKAGSIILSLSVSAFTQKKKNTLLPYVLASQVQVPRNLQTLSTLYPPEHLVNEFDVAVQQIVAKNVDSRSGNVCVGWPKSQQTFGYDALVNLRDHFGAHNEKILPKNCKKSEEVFLEGHKHFGLFIMMCAVQFGKSPLFSIHDEGLHKIDTKVSNKNYFHSLSVLWRKVKGDGGEDKFIRRLADDAMKTRRAVIEAYDSKQFQHFLQNKHVSTLYVALYQACISNFVDSIDEFLSIFVGYKQEIKYQDIGFTWVNEIVSEWASSVQDASNVSDPFLIWLRCYCSIKQPSQTSVVERLEASGNVPRLDVEAIKWATSSLSSNIYHSVDPLVVHSSFTSDITKTCIPNSNVKPSPPVTSSSLTRVSDRMRLSYISSVASVESPYRGFGSPVSQVNNIDPASLQEWIMTPDGVFQQFQHVLQVTMANFQEHTYLKDLAKDRDYRLSGVEEANAARLKAEFVRFKDILMKRVAGWEYTAKSGKTFKGVMPVEELGTFEGFGVFGKHIMKMSCHPVSHPSPYLEMDKPRHVLVKTLLRHLISQQLECRPRDQSLFEEHCLKNSLKCLGFSLFGPAGLGVVLLPEENLCSPFSLVYSGGFDLPSAGDPMGEDWYYEVDMRGCTTRPHDKYDLSLMTAFCVGMFLNNYERQSWNVEEMGHPLQLDKGLVRLHDSWVLSLSKRKNQRRRQLSPISEHNSLTQLCWSYGEGFTHKYKCVVCSLPMGDTCCRAYCDSDNCGSQCHALCLPEPKLTVQRRVRLPTWTCTQCSQDEPAIPSVVDKLKALSRLCIGSLVRGDDFNLGMVVDCSPTIKVIELNPSSEGNSASGKSGKIECRSTDKSICAVTHAILKSHPLDRYTMECRPTIFPEPTCPVKSCSFALKRLGISASLRSIRNHFSERHLKLMLEGKPSIKESPLTRKEVELPSSKQSSDEPHEIACPSCGLRNAKTVSSSAPVLAILEHDRRFWSSHSQEVLEYVATAGTRTVYHPVFSLNCCVLRDHGYGEPLTIQYQTGNPVRRKLTRGDVLPCTTECPTSPRLVSAYFRLLKRVLPMSVHVFLPEEHICVRSDNGMTRYLTAVIHECHWYVLLWDSIQKQALILNCMLEVDCPPLITVPEKIMQFFEGVAPSEDVTPSEVFPGRLDMEHVFVQRMEHNSDCGTSAILTTIMCAFQPSLIGFCAEGSFKTRMLYDLIVDCSSLGLRARRFSMPSLPNYGECYTLGDSQVCVMDAAKAKPSWFDKFYDMCHLAAFVHFEPNATGNSYQSKSSPQPFGSVDMRNRRRCNLNKELEIQHLLRNGPDAVALFIGEESALDSDIKTILKFLKVSPTFLVFIVGGDILSQVQKAVEAEGVSRAPIHLVEPYKELFGFGTKLSGSVSGDTAPELNFSQLPVDAMLQLGMNSMFCPKSSVKRSVMPIESLLRANQSVKLSVSSPSRSPCLRQSKIKSTTRGKDNQRTMQVPNMFFPPWSRDPRSGASTDHKIHWQSLHKAMLTPLSSKRSSKQHNKVDLFFNPSPSIGKGKTRLVQHKMSPRQRFADAQGNFLTFRDACLTSLCGFKGFTVSAEVMKCAQQSFMDPNFSGPTHFREEIVVLIRFLLLVMRGSVHMDKTILEDMETFSSRRTTPCAVCENMKFSEFGPQITKKKKSWMLGKGHDCTRWPCVLVACGVGHMVRKKICAFTEINFFDYYRIAGEAHTRGRDPPPWMLFFDNLRIDLRKMYTRLFNTFKKEQQDVFPYSIHDCHNCSSSCLEFLRSFVIDHSSNRMEAEELRRRAAMFNVCVEWVAAVELICEPFIRDTNECGQVLCTDACKPNYKFEPNRSFGDGITYTQKGSCSHVRNITILILDALSGGDKRPACKFGENLLNRRSPLSYFAKALCYLAKSLRCFGKSVSRPVLNITTSKPLLENRQSFSKSGRHSVLEPNLIAASPIRIYVTRKQDKAIWRKEGREMCIGTLQGSNFVCSVTMVDIDKNCLRIGEGSYGVCYKVFWKDSLGVLKLYCKGKESLRQGTLEKEVNGIKRAHNVPGNALKLVGKGTCGSYPALIMSFIAGNTMSTWLKDKQADKNRQDISSVCVSLIDALMRFHEKGLIHGDLKEDNVIVGSQLTAHLIDFGLSARLQTVNARVRTGFERASEVESTRCKKQLCHLPREQFERTLFSGATDAYSLAVLLSKIPNFVHNFENAGKWVKSCLKFPKAKDMHKRPQLSALRNAFLSEVEGKNSACDIKQLSLSASSKSCVASVHRRCTLFDEFVSEDQEATLSGNV